MDNLELGTFMFILQDWAGNRLTDFQGCEIEFNSFDDGWDYILSNYDEEDCQELFIIEVE